MGIPHRDAKIQSQIGSEELLHLFINQWRLMVEDQREQENIKQATIQCLGPKVLNGPMELIKGKPFAVEWSY